MGRGRGGAGRQQAPTMRGFRGQGKTFELYTFIFLQQTFLRYNLHKMYLFYVYSWVGSLRRVHPGKHQNPHIEPSDHPQKFPHCPVVPATTAFYFCNFSDSFLEFHINESYE